MELINNTTKTLRDDLSVEIKEGSKLSIAAACFSIYAFQELKKQLSDIDEFRFIFTSPTFITEKAKKENPVPEEKVAKKETSKRTRKTTTNVRKKAVPHPATPEKAQKSYTKEQYAEAVQMVEDRGVIYVGVLINHFRISANTAISIMNQMREENLVTENGALVKNTKEHKIRWGKDE